MYYHSNQSGSDNEEVTQLFPYHLNRSSLITYSEHPFEKSYDVLRIESVYSKLRRQWIVPWVEDIAYEVPSISFQTFFVWALLFIVHTWNSSPLRSNLLQLQYTCCIIPTTSGRPSGSPLVWACQWPSSQPLSPPQLFLNDSLWA